MFGAEGFDGNDGGEEQTVKIKKRAGSRGNVIEVEGQTYQPTGDLQNRGMASLVKKNPELQQAIAAKGGKHSHQGDPGQDPQRQERYHQQDQQLDQQIKEKGGTPGGKRSAQQDGEQGSEEQGGGSQVNRQKMVDQVMSKKNVDRPTAERIVARAGR